MRPVLGMIDLGVSNVRSVKSAFQRVGAEVRTVESGADLDGFGAVVLPGVGAFGDGMASLRDQGLVEPLRHHAVAGRRPLMGICLGMQLLADRSEEHGSHEGLGIVPGHVRRLRASRPGLRVPNMGWCDVTVTKASWPLWARERSDEAFYFAHSYHLVCQDSADVCATLEFDGAVAAAIQRGNTVGIQFHPEKSQEAGLDLLEAFCRYVTAAG